MTLTLFILLIYSFDIDGVKLMRILHTADLHLGRQFNGIPLIDDHDAILHQIYCAVKEHNVDVLIIAGDIFDRITPPISAVRQFNSFIKRVTENEDVALVLIAGNHDSADRIDAMSIMTDKSRAHVRGNLSAQEKPLIINDKHGVIAFSALPFSYEYAARECFEDESINSPEDVLNRQILSAREHLPIGARWVIVAHAFVNRAQTSESERSLTRVGGIETVSAEIFEDANYVALGHLHRPQKVLSDHIRYSGAPLAFSFDEADTEKSMYIVDLNETGVPEIKAITFAPIRQVRVVRGKHAELMLNQHSTDFIKVILTDEAPIIDGMRRLRKVYPNACDLTYERNDVTLKFEGSRFESASVTQPCDLVNDFVQTVRAEAIGNEEQAIVTETLNALQLDEASE